MHVRENVTQPADPSYRLIPLTQGKIAAVDSEDYEYLSKSNWCAILDEGDRWYAFSNGRWMHRVIMRDPPGFKVDHKDRDGLNNRKYNLRVATHQQNMANRKIQSNNTSGFKGVSPYRDKWRAKVTVNGERLSLGVFSSPESAHEAVRLHNSEAFGEFYREH